MNSSEQQRFDFLYEQHLTNLTLQGKQPRYVYRSVLPDKKHNQQYR